MRQSSRTQREASQFLRGGSQRRREVLGGLFFVAARQDIHADFQNAAVHGQAVQSRAVQSDAAVLLSARTEVVYLDSGFMQTQLSAFGDFGPAMIIAHEIGHHIQNLLGLTGGFTIQQELQADCLAGGWMKDAGARGLLEVGDSQEAANSLFTLGDPVGTPWFDPDAHGTAQQRVEAFRVGFLSGVGSCF